MTGRRDKARVSAACLLLLLCVGSQAWAKDWTVDLAQSRLRFSATQQAAAFDGAFLKFDAKVRFDPAKPADGQITASIQTGSIDTQNAERDGYLRDADWFDVRKWPLASFKTRKITQAAAPSSFSSAADLTIRDRTRPVMFNFTFAVQKDGTARLTGTADLKRLDFNVGSGMWTNTDWVGNEVRVSVDLLLRPAIKP